MTKHHYVGHKKGKCECKMQKLSARNLQEHARAKGHRILYLPSKQGGQKGGIVY